MINLQTEHSNEPSLQELVLQINDRSIKEEGKVDLSRKMLDEFLIESNGCLGDFSNESSTLAASNVSQSNVYKKSSPIPI